MLGIIAVGLIFFIGIAIQYPDAKLVRNYEYQQMGIGNRSYNEILVDFYSDKDPDNLTISWYPYINYLPGLEGRAIFVDISTVGEIKKYLKRDDVHYVLQYNSTPSEIVDFLNGLFEKGQLTFITDFGVKNDAVLFEVVR
jgi:hypothetical protein